MPNRSFISSYEEIAYEFAITNPKELSNVVGPYSQNLKLQNQFRAFIAARNYEFDLSKMRQQALAQQIRIKDELDTLQQEMARTEKESLTPEAQTELSEIKKGAQASAAAIDSAYETIEQNFNEISSQLESSEKEIQKLNQPWIDLERAQSQEVVNALEAKLVPELKVAIGKANPRLSDKERDEAAKAIGYALIKNYKKTQEDKAEEGHTQALAASRAMESARMYNEANPDNKVHVQDEAAVAARLGTGKVVNDQVTIFASLSKESKKHNVPLSNAAVSKVVKDVYPKDAVMSQKGDVGDAEAKVVALTALLQYMRETTKQHEKSVAKVEESMARMNLSRERVSNFRELVQALKGEPVGLTVNQRTGGISRK